MPGMITTRLPFKELYLTIWISERQREKENSTNKYTTWNFALKSRKIISKMRYEVKLSSFNIGHTRLTQRLLFTRNNQHAEMWKSETENQALLPGVLLMKGEQKKIYYSCWYKNITGKRLWIEKDNDVP